MQIPFMDLKRQYESIRAEIDPAVSKILQSADFIGGPIKEQFEKDFATACGAKYCIGVGNGTDAITIVLKAMGIGAGDEVVTQANSFIASAEAVSMTGAKPVFVDVDEKNFLMDLKKLDTLLSTRAHTRGGKIKAVIPVHLYGQSTNMTELMAIAKKYQVKVMEDCAQAHLAKWEGKSAGTHGDASTFSFYPGKNLGAYGDGGAIVTSSDEIYNLAKKLANHGRISKYDHEMEGYNSRLDTLQAAILSVKLKHLQKWSDERYEKARIYDQELASLEPKLIRPVLPAKGQHVFHLYVIRTKQRDQLQKFLQEKGIATIVHYPITLPNLKAYAHMNHKPSDFPVATQMQSEILSLPMFPEITHDEQMYVCKSVKDFFVGVQ